MPIRSAAFLLLCLGCPPVHAGGPAHVAAKLPGYAPVKQRVCSDCPTPKPGIPLPRHAVVVGSWGFFSHGNDYRVVDLDNGTLVKTFVPSPAVPKQRAPKARHHTIMLPKSALPRLVELANRIWAERSPIRTRKATDVSWDLWLIDGQQVRHESGTGLPDGLAAEWLHCIDELAGAHGK